MSPNFKILPILLLVALPYLFSLNTPFVYDDHGEIVENAYLKNTEHVRDLLTLKTLGDDRILDGRRPMVLLSYFVDLKIWGVQAFGFHVTNLLLHLANVIGVFFLLSRLTQHAQTRIPWIAALLFGLHPVLTEAVHVPAFREDLLVTFFGMAFLFVMCSGASPPAPFGGRAGVKRRTALRSSAATCIFVLALLSKESAVVLPLLLLLIWWCFPATRPPRRHVLIAVAMPFIIAGLFFVGSAPQSLGTVWNGLSLQFPANLLTTPWIWLRYLGLLVWPHPLCADYVISPLSSILDPRFLFAAMLVIAFVIAGLVLHKRQPAVSFGLGWILITYLPVSNLLPLFNPMAERYLYFMAIGYALVLATIFQNRKTVIFIISLFYAVVTTNRLGDWKSDFDLWTATLAQEPRSARAHTWLGLEMKKRGDAESARQYFEQASELNPQDVTSLINLAILYGEQGDLSRAEQLLREAIRRNPDKTEARENLAVALKMQGRHEEAEREIQKNHKP